MNHNTKPAALLLALLLTLQLCLPASASTQGVSSYMSAFGWQPEEFVSADLSLGCAVVLSILDAASVCGLNVDEVDLSKPCRVGLTPSGLGVDVVFGSMDNGFFNTVWYPADNSIFLERIDGFLPDSPGITYHPVPEEAITAVLDILSRKN